ncbi:MAG TPA: ABC transporter ATP-binding protein, partial [Bacteroidetes bacterium]|nr:ABC transporter ATP-binding protein [Bacteroidota bacterium]
MLFFVFFSAFSLTVVMPFINVLFQPETSASSTVVDQPARVQQPGESNLPVPTGKLPDLRRQFEQKLNQLLASRPKKQSLTILCLVIAVGFFFKNLFRVGQAYFMAPVEQGVIRDLRSQLFRHYQRLSLRYFAGERAGQLISRVIYDVSVINASITAAINSFFR